MVEEELIDMADPKQIDEVWNSFCNEVFEYHNKQLTNLDKKQKEEYLKTISELEFRIWTVIKMGDIVNLELTLHKDYLKVHKKFMVKSIDKLFNK